MSIFDRIMKRKNESNRVPEVPEVAEESQVKQVFVALETRDADQELNSDDQKTDSSNQEIVQSEAVSDDASKTGDVVEVGDRLLPLQVDATNVVSSDQNAVTVEVDPASDIGSDKSAGEEQKTIETIPLGHEEISALYRNGYETASKRCTKTFIIEKIFWAQDKNTDPAVYGSKVIKVKRVAQIKAASFMHALNMIEWDRKNVTLVAVNDDYKGEIDVRVNGKVVGKVTIPVSAKFSEDGPSLKFEQMCGSQRKEFIAIVKKVAVDDPVVKEFFKAKGLSKVTGWSFAHNSHISLSVSKAPKPPKETKSVAKPEVKAEVKPVDPVVESQSDPVPPHADLVVPQETAVEEVLDTVSADPAAGAFENCQTLQEPVA